MQDYSSLRLFVDPDYWSCITMGSRNGRVSLAQWWGNCFQVGLEGVVVMVQGILHLGGKEGRKE